MATKNRNAGLITGRLQWCHTMTTAVPHERHGPQHVVVTHHNPAEVVRIANIIERAMERDMAERERKGGTDE